MMFYSVAPVSCTVELILNFLLFSSEVSLHLARLSCVLWTFAPAKSELSSSDSWWGGGTFYCTKWLQVIIRLLLGATFSSGNTDNSILADRRERSRECSVLCMSLWCTIRVLHSDTVLSLLHEISCCRDASTSPSITLDSVPLPLYIISKQETNLVPYRYERNGTADEVVTFKVTAQLSNDYFCLCAHLWALLCRACSYVKLNNKWGVVKLHKIVYPYTKI